MNRLQVVRERLKLTQKQLSEISSVPQQTISAIESGQRKNPGIITVRKLAEALQCGVEEIFPCNESDKKCTEE